jgi:hypothetical protein
MKRMLSCLLFLVILGASSSTMRAQTAENCIILDVVQANSHDSYYIDGVLLAPNVDLLDALRKREGANPHVCLNAFVPLTMTLRSVESLRASAGKLQFEEAHIYVYGRYHEYVTEVLGSGDTESVKVRTTKAGALPWPK